jgi:endonuclease/exonuclease/phosphatase family metal-dependent hydrolase
MHPPRRSTGPDRSGHRRWWRTASLACLAIVGACTTENDASRALPPDDAPVVRVATFNIFELGDAKLDARDGAGAPTDTQLVAAAEIIRTIRPDILLLNEIDAPPDDPARVARRFARELLATGADSIAYPYVYAAPSNTGELSGFDLNRDGVVATSADLGTRAHGDDSWGYGTYPGQYGMAVLSRHPIDTLGVRTFRQFRWADLPGAHLPDGWFPDSVRPLVRLSSKSHWDVPIVLGADTLHLLASHPTPPGFDGAEDRNGRRNFDEIGLWRHYLDGSDAIVDDGGRRGGLAPTAAFVIAGDLNAAPTDTQSRYDDMPAIAQLLAHARVTDPPVHQGRPTAFFRDSIRIDYVLPASFLRVLDGGVVWPTAADDSAGEVRARRASDHRMVWLDLARPFRAR